MKLVAIDLETSGLNPWLHGALSLGAEKIETGETFYRECRLAPDKHWQGEALAVNGRTVDSLTAEHLPEPADAVEEFHEWLGEDERWMLIGQNVGKHDWWFLAGMGPLAPGPIQHRTLDLHTLAVACAAAGRMPEPPAWGWGADAIFEACGLGAEPKPHNALTGARLAAAAWRVMTGRLGDEKGRPGEGETA